MTTTFNRKHLLPRLYESLRKQQVRNNTFEWLVVDDGSTDGTTEWLEGLAADKGFSIRTFRQDNGGKHRALNRGSKKIRSPWVLIVDSDDWLLPNGMNMIGQLIESVGTDIKAIVAPLEIETHSFGPYKEPGKIVNYARWQSLSGGDSSVLMRRQVFDEYNFPEHENEFFVAESAFYARTFRLGGVLLSNQRLVGAEYQPEGLSARASVLRLQNPLGCLSTYSAQMAAWEGGSNWIKACLNYHRFYWHAYLSGRRPNLSGFKSRLVWLVATVPLYLLDRIKYSIR